MTLVSRAVEAGIFRIVAGAGEFDVGGVCVSVVAVPAAFRFLEVTPGVDSLALPFAFAGPPLPPKAWRATSCCVRFVSGAFGAEETAESAAGFFFVVADDENSKSMSWSSA